MTIIIVLITIDIVIVMISLDIDGIDLTCIWLIGGNKQ